MLLTSDTSINCAKFALPTVPDTLAPAIFVKFIPLPENRLAVTTLPPMLPVYVGRYAATFELPYVVASLAQLNTPLPLVDNTCPAVPPVIVILPTAPKLAVVPTANVVIDATPVVLKLPTYAVPLLVILPFTVTLPDIAKLVKLPTDVIFGCAALVTDCANIDTAAAV